MAAARARAARRAAAAALAKRENQAIDRLLQRQPFIRSGGSERREIALTFDDGPGPYTPRLLDQLARLHVPATFFEIGFMLRWFHASTVREVHLADAIGDHTENHPMMARLSAGTQQARSTRRPSGSIATARLFRGCGVRRTAPTTRPRSGFCTTIGC